MRKDGKKRRGALAFEWVIITTLLAVGLISGLGALRNSVLDKLDDMTTSVERLNTAANTNP